MNKKIIYTLLFILSVMLSPLNLMAQEQMVTLIGDNITLKTAFEQIEKQTGLSIDYDSSVDVNHKIKSLPKSNKVSKVFDLLFKETGYTYKFNKSHVIISAPTPPASKENASPQQKRGLKGKVIDISDNTPLIGANVMIKGEDTGVSTDLEGNFSLQVESSSILQISYIGYKTREILVGDLGFIEIKLKSENALEELVVVGAGTQKKVSVTGSIATIKGSSLSYPSSSLTNNIAGRLAGVIANTTSGEPGSASQFYIRGISTFGGRTTPLIILDDVEISAEDLNNIPAETIESFSVLKDASATAIYGARGANGVMLVTTKRGRENTKTNINITLENSFSKPVNFPEFTDGATWMGMYVEAQTTRNPNAVPKYTTDDILATRDGINPYVYPDVDWRSLIFKNMAMSQRANINIQGGGSKVTYYTSLNVSHDAGLLNSPKLYSWNNNINNMSYNFQNNIQITVTPTTKIRLNMNAQVRDNKGPNYSTSELFGMMLTTNPVYFPAYFPAAEGDTYRRFGSAPFTSNQNLRTNPYAYMASSFKQADINTINTSLKIDQDLKFITSGLSINALINFKNYSHSSYNQTIEPYYYRVRSGSYDPDKNTFETELLKEGTDYISQSNISKTGDRTIMMQFQLAYDRRFGLHNVGGMLMYMQRDYKSNVLPERNQGISGRFTYDYDQRYLAEVNFGYNGTERLDKDNRFELFPAVSLGWVVSNENFFVPINEMVTHLKLRASYGLIGSDDLTYPSRFLYIENVTLANRGFTTGDEWNVWKGGPTINRYPVSGAGWERSRKLDIGLDIFLFKDWHLTFDYFHEHRYNILMERATWPNSFGYRSAMPWSNIGKVNNWGYEVSSNYTARLAKDLTLDIRGNFTYTQNKYVFKDEIEHPYPWLVETGRPLSTMYGYVAEGLFTNQDEIDNHARQELGSTPMVGDIKYRDLNGDGVINEYDQAYISNLGTQPRIQYGFGTTLTWKKFDVGVFFNGSAMRRIMIQNIHPFGQHDHNIFQFIADDHWAESNQNANAQYPRLGLNDTDTKNNQVASTYWMRNGNFLRFKTLEIGYRFKYGRVFLNGDNLFVFSPFKHWDPELSWNSYPLQRTFNLGVQLNF